jgi:hypothetical protein
MSSGNVFDPSRIAKIAKITPSFLDFARPGDEIQLGMDGDPNFPAMYRGSNRRPTGTILRVEGDPGSRVCTARFGNATRELHEGNTAPGLIWEFTEKGFRGVMERQKQEQRHAKEEKETSEYRGILGARSSTKEVSALKTELSDLKTQMSHIHNIVVSVSDGLARDIQGIVTKSHEPVFAGALLREIANYTSNDSSSGKPPAADNFQFSDDEDYVSE